MENKTIEEKTSKQFMPLINYLFAFSSPVIFIF